MTVEYVGDGKYIGTLRHRTGTSVLYGADRMDIIMSLIEASYEKVGEVQQYRYDEEAWTDDDWEREFRRDEIIGQHKDDDKI